MRRDLLMKMAALIQTLLEMDLLLEVLKIRHQSTPHRHLTLQQLVPST